jgi:hypothetical protein
VPHDPAAVPHGGKDLMPWGATAGMLPPWRIFPEIFGLSFYFSKIKEKNPSP